MNITTRTFGTIGSTNTEALERARQGAAEGLCIIARRQTAGRGRYGRKWLSEKDAGLYLSIILRPNLPTQFLPLITLMSGVAVHDMLQEYGIRPDIKWVNDILVDEKKISGILAETAETAEGIAVIVGIGINLTSQNYPAETEYIATSIEEAAGVKIAAEDAAGALTKYLSYFYKILSGPDGTAAIIDEWRRRSTYFAGKNVRIAMGHETITGITDGLEPNGALRVRKPEGDIAVVQTGDVERLRAEKAA
jgi:BirA family biotin operon repressor/biotin-[acetyl-CoA-carboxylase] ligase